MSDEAPKREGLTRGARKRIEAEIANAEAEHKRQLQRKRIELAQHGVRAYNARKHSEAVTAFMTYLRILEEMKGCGEGGLRPSNFDKKEDIHELLLLSGVYWDLAKLFDRTKSESKRKQFRHYMEKFVLFSKGMPFEPVCAETMRKYISNEKPVHREDFKNAYKILGGSNCFIATSLVDHVHVDTMPTLREFRDGTLSRTFAGRALTDAYYRFGPSIAAALDRCPDSLRRVVARTLDRLAEKVRRP